MPAATAPLPHLDGRVSPACSHAYLVGPLLLPSAFASGGRAHLGDTINGAHKIIGFFDPLSAFGTDLYYKVHATSLTSSDPSLMQTSYLEAP